MGAETIRETPSMEVSHPRAGAICGCTIVARNYFAQAEVLARSFREHHPDWSFVILVVDELSANGQGPNGERVLTLADLDLNPRDLHHMPMLYDVTEFSTAVKPWLLRRLRRDGAEVAMYFDPDIEIFSRLDPLAELAREHSIVLTPHVTTPIPQDDRLLCESDILGAGIYNLGFIAIGPESEPFLDWWASRLRRESVIDPSRMRFTDQRWVDFVPGLFRHHILRDPGFNVAYWNLHGRSLSRNGEGYKVNGQPLRFFHYSGYDPERPHVLSKHQRSRPRIFLSEQPIVRQLCDRYRGKLFAAGFSVATREPYGFECLSNGLRLDRRIRRAYREALVRFENAGGPEPPSPFAPGNENAFVDWLNEPLRPAPVVTRYMLAVHTDRDDLRAAFPEPLGAHAAAYRAWFFKDGLIQEHVHASLIPPAWSPSHEVDQSGVPSATQGEPVVTVVGYFRAELGIGEAARLLLLGLESAALPYQTVSCQDTLNRQNHPFDERGEGAGTPSDVNIVCVNADQTPVFGRKMGPEFYRGRYTIGLWFWEVEEFPAALHSAFDFVDEIWVATEFMREALSRVSPKPVHKFHLPLVWPRLDESISRADLGFPEQFTFLFSFDFLSVLERKNPFGVIDAFKRAFQPGEGPVLFIKTINGEKNALDLERVKLAAIDRPDIITSDRYLSAQEKNAMMAHCDCYISLHRSEGFGLTIAEAMSFAKPVIATAYSGNLEFMTPANSYLCPYEFCRVGEGAEPYSATARWAQPDLAVAAALMREVYLDREGAAARGRRAAEDIAMLHGPGIAGPAIAERITVVRDLIHPPAPKAPLAPVPDVSISRAPIAKRRRSALWRMMRRFLLHFLKEERLRLTNLEKGRDVSRKKTAETQETAARLQATVRDAEESRAQFERIVGERFIATEHALAATQVMIERERKFGADVQKRLQAMGETVAAMRTTLDQQTGARADLEKRFEAIDHALATTQAAIDQKMANAPDLLSELRAVRAGLENRLNVVESVAESTRVSADRMQVIVDNLSKAQGAIRVGLEKRLQILERLAEQAVSTHSLQQNNGFIGDALKSLSARLEQIQNQINARPPS